MALKQQSRVGEFKGAALGQDELALARFDGSEGLSELFTYTVDVVSEQENFKFDKVLGTKCTVSLTSYDKVRHFNGMLVEAQWTGVIAEAQWTGDGKPLFIYRLVLRPWLWLLSRTSDCRIFADKSARDIIKEVLSEYDFAKVSDILTESYEKLEYFVQYRETDLNFVSRTMEEFGIYYFFEHTDGEHTLVLADSKTSHSDCGSIPYHPVQARAAKQEEHLVHWVPGRRFNTGKVELNDYDYFNPSADIISRSLSTSNYPNSKLEVYDYPGRYIKQPDGERFAKVRLEAEQATDERCQATGEAASLFPGALVNLKEHRTHNKQYLVVRAMHSFSTEMFTSGATSDFSERYSGRYEFLPSDKPFRSPMLTPKPVVRGPQTAKVVGEGEIDVDKHGRIKVQFHWDRKKKESRLVRIGQVWSGKKWGGIFIPRVGMEVIVDYLEGDPDQPLVVGTVYNEDNKWPFDLPGKKNIAGWKTRSTEGGAEEDYNELVFDDSKGKEKIRVHAQKDMGTTVENDDSQTVKNNRNITVNGTHSEMVDGVMTIESRTMIVLKVGPLSSITIDSGSITLNSCAINLTASGAITETAPLITITGNTSLMLATNVFIARLNGGTPVITF